MPKDIEIMAESIVRRCAHILGNSSAAAMALADAEKRKHEGQNPVFYWSRSARMIFVTDAGR